MNLSMIRTAARKYLAKYGKYPNIIYLSPTDADEISKACRPEFVNFTEELKDKTKLKTVDSATIEVKDSLLVGEIFCVYKDTVEDN